ncbi:hypothetical protein C1645_730642 [Glomus cerebriforme]|uniref:Uncharacterized protein n=1 Tax=Glomus cerebriforme TaxID=658196 RepID=A0A397TNF0_9GLOM|nr:hypothetical protein C1645_730642 [Glomus cerebriforme]
MSQSSNNSIKIDVISEISVENDDNSSIESPVETDDEIFSEKNDKPHNGKPITMIEVSPKETYLVIFSKKDKSFIGWNVENVENVENEFQLDYHRSFVEELKKSDDTFEHEIEIRKFCVSDDKKLAYIYNYNCEYIHYKSYEVISLSKYDKLYLLFSNIYIHEWDFLTENSIRIFGNKEEIKASDIRIFSSEKFIWLKIKDEIIINSIKLGIPIISLDANNVFTKIDVKNRPPEIQQQSVKEVKTLKEQTNIQTFDYIDFYTINDIYSSVMLNDWKKMVKNLF